MVLNTKRNQHSSRGDMVFVHHGHAHGEGARTSTGREWRMKRMLARYSWCIAAALVLALGAPAAFASQPTDAVARAAAEDAALLGAQTEASYAFEGCWTYWASGPCRDVYRDSSGEYWLCRLCGQTTNPGPSQCSRISIQTLNIGYWCS
jgi:hypothetical protein